jgi:beta-ureidopropionase / N-carbamoyl-L-amino-acid hydrolase
VTGSQLRVDGARLNRDLADLATIGRLPAADGAPAGISRTSFSAGDATAREWYRARCDEAGLALRFDGLGNMFASLPGAPDVPGVWTGSHLDTVPQGGAYDGALGALAALECVRRIAESGVQVNRPVQAVVFSDEEGNYDHLLGSTGLYRGYDQQQLDTLTGRDGDRLVDALADWTFADGPPTATRIEPGSLDSFVELHIEQGPRLEREGIDIGVVTSIVGLSGGVVEFIGRADHAGTTPMTMRQDALRAAAQFVLAMPELAAATGPSSVITTGRIHVEPGGQNVVPRLAALTLDFRDPDGARVAELARGIAAAAQDAARAHGVSATWHEEGAVAPTPLDDSVRSVIADAADGLGLSRIDLPSGAGHDSQNMAHLAPTGMIFVPSRDGRSHCPEEYTDPEQLVRGADVLLTTLLTLANR